MVDFFEFVAARLADADRLAAAPLRGRAQLVLVRTQLASRQGFSRIFPELWAPSLPSSPPARSQEACQGVDRLLNKPRFAPLDDEGLQIGW